MEEQEVDENGSRIQNPAQEVDENGSEELDLESIERLLVKNLCAKDLNGNPKCLWLPKKQVEENLLQLPFPQLGEEIILTFHDPIDKKSFTVQLVHADQEEYYITGRGWEEYVAQHKLESGDFISSYKKNDYYVIYTWKLPTAEELDDTHLLVPSESIERVPVLVKNLCAKDPKGLRLSKNQVEGNLVEHPFPQVGQEIILPLHDPIGKKSFTVQLVHADQEEYYITGRGWEEYVAQHNLLIFDDTTIFVNKVVLDPTAEVHLVNISYHYEITYQTTGTNQPPQKLKPLGITTENSSAPASTGTTTAVDNSSAPASTTTATTTAVDNSSATLSTATTTAAVDNSSASPTTATTTAVNNSSAPASTGTTTAVDSSSAPASTAIITAVDNSSAPASTTDYNNS
ncbi:uncharacterized protein LOC129881656 isoform X2 [Solanum dulcamara]|uniref:uncharacterized protein LOC129881656 isoform X2 n=1 Tax=Solanum dulcamara TaxID=45834 RepID=UPI0024857231|nr:uncharacterized protein LOC129881656 isoform X2 [Solanum dulcamara]